MSTGVDTFSIADHLGLATGKGYIAAGLIGMIILFVLFHQELKKRTCEFATFYVGAHLVGTRYLYDDSHNKDEQARAIHAESDALSYVRLPFYAALLSPLARLPYQAALYVWQGCSVLAILVFIALWPDRRVALIACCWSLPLLMVFMYGEDDAFLLAILALVLAAGKRHPVVAGLLMSLLGIKFNLFLLLPVLLVAQRRWSMATSFALGCVCELGMSFVVASTDWPLQMLHVIGKRSILPHEYLMPNLRGLLASMTSDLWPEITLGALIAITLFVVVRRSNFHMGLVATLVGSLLVSHHAGPEDCVILIPVLLVLGSSVISTVPFYGCLLLLSPIPYYLLVVGTWAGMVAKLVFVALLAYSFQVCMTHLSRSDNALGSRDYAV